MNGETTSTAPVFENVDGCIYSEDRTVLLSAPASLESCAVLPECTAIAPNAFKTCEALSRVDLPEGLQEIGDYAFSFTALRSLDCPSGLRSIGAKAFYSCERLERFHANKGLESLGDEVFDATGLRSLRLPASVRALGHRMLRHSWLAEHYAPGALSVDPGNGRFVFDDEGALYARHGEGLVLLELMVANVAVHRVLPGTVRISSGAYRLNRVIRHVVLPEGVREIGNGAFRMCTALERVEVPDSLESIGADAFYETALTSIRLPRGFRHLGMCALATTGGNTGNAPTLERIEVAPDNPRFHVRSGFLLERRDEGDFLVCHFGTQEIVRIPTSVTMLGPYCLSGCECARALVVHDRIRRIHSTAFMLGTPIEFVRVLLHEPVGGRDCIDLCFPRSSVRNTVFARAFFEPLSKWVRATDVNAHAMGLFNLGTTVKHLKSFMREEDGRRDGSTVPAPGQSSGPRGFTERSAFAIDEYEGGLDVERLCTFSDHAVLGLFHDPRPFAVLALRRLEAPVFLSEAHRVAMLDRLESQLVDIVADCARCGDTATVDKLIDRGLVNPMNIGDCIAAANAVSDITLSSFLLQVKRERFGQATFDFGI